MQKYPKTYHFGFSEGLQNDDRIIENADMFIDKTIVVSEKVDGECSGLSREGCHARSLDSGDHISRHWLKGLWGQIKHQTPEGWELFGENMYAKHSIFYNTLPSYFLLFSICNDKNEYLSWEDVNKWAELLRLDVVPVLYFGPWNEKQVKACWTGVSKFGPEQEGYVVRSANSFNCDDFANNVAKYVRKNHVQTSENWMFQAVIQNELA